MTRYRIKPVPREDWRLERWVEPRHGWLFTRPGYWEYVTCGFKEEMRRVGLHLAQPVEEIP